MDTFNIQEFAATEANQYYTFINPDTASIRIPVSLNENSEVAVEGDTYAGTKNFNFANVKVEATANELIYGSAFDINGPASTSGIITTFIVYLLGGNANLTGMKKTIIQSAIQSVYTPEPETPVE